MQRYLAPDPHLETLQYLSLSQETTFEFVSKLVLPALTKQRVSLSLEEFSQLTSDGTLEVTQFSIETHDGAILDSIAVTPVSELSKPVSDQYFIIKFNGNGALYNIYLDEFRSEAEKICTTVIGFDYRGVCNSTKMPTRLLDLIVDGIAQVQRLLDLGADPEKITLDGRSLGAGVATIVASFYHYQNKRVYLFNDRSFASLLVSFANGFEAKFPLVSLLERQVEWGFNIRAWEANLITAYKMIPHTHKAYMVIAKQSAKTGSEGDGNLLHSGSFHRGIKNLEKENPPSTGYKVIAHSNLFPDKPCGHSAARRQLISKSDPSQTGEDIFENFVRSHKR